MPPDFESRLKDVEDRLAQIGMQRLSYPMDSTSKGIIQRVLKEQLPDEVFNSVWSNYIYHSTTFDNIDAYTINVGTVTNDPGQGVIASTGVISGAEADFKRNLTYDTFLRWDMEQRFKTSIQINSATSMEAVLGIGKIQAPSSAALGTNFGFYITNGAIQGQCNNQTNQTRLALGVNMSALTSYELEARFIPNYGVLFFVNGVQRGLIQTNLPSADTSNIPHTTFIGCYVKTNAAGTKILYISFFEFIQKRFKQLLS